MQERKEKKEEIKMHVFISPAFPGGVHGARYFGGFYGVNFLGIKREGPLVFDNSRRRARLGALEGSLHWRKHESGNRQVYTFAALNRIPVDTDGDRQLFFAGATPLPKGTFKRSDKVFFADDLTLPLWLGQRLVQKVRESRFNAPSRRRIKTAEEALLERFRKFGAAFLRADLEYYDEHGDEYAPDTLSPEEAAQHSATLLLNEIFDRGVI